MSTDNTINFLLESGWEFDRNTGLVWHWKHSPEEISLDEAMQIQDAIDPESVKEFKLLNNLNSKQAHLYYEYLDS